MDAKPGAAPDRLETRSAIQLLRVAAKQKDPANLPGPG
jgi:hypothetical protein